IDRLAEQDDLLAPFGGELADLGRDVLGWPALLGPAHAGHDAIGAELVAADHDPDIGLERRGPHGRVTEGIVAFEASLDIEAGCFGTAEAKSQLGGAGMTGYLN